MIRSRGHYYRRLKRLTSPLTKHNNNRLGALLWDDSFNPTTTIFSYHVLVIVIVILILLALLASTVYFYREPPKVAPPLVSSTGSQIIGGHGSQSIPFSSSSSSSSSSPSPSFPIPMMIQSSALLNPLYYTLQNSSNVALQYQACETSDDGTTAVCCNSNCSFSLCNIFRNNHIVNSITSALNPGLSYNLGSFGLLSVSANGTTIAIGAYGCGSGTSGIYIFDETYLGSNIWVPNIVPQSGGSYLIDNFDNMYDNNYYPNYPLIFLLSSDGNKLVYLGCNGCRGSTFLYTIIRPWNTAQIVKTALAGNQQGAGFPVYPTGATMTSDGQTLYMITGYLAQGCGQ